MKYYIVNILYILLLAGCSSSNPSPNSPNKASSIKVPERKNEESDGSKAGPLDQEPQREAPSSLSSAEILEAKKELAKQKSTYTELIRPNLDNDYSGFHRRYISFKEENSFLTRLTPDEVLFFAELSDLVYVNKFKTIDEIEVGLLEKIAADKYKNYELLGTVKRANKAELSAAMLYSKEKNHFIVVFRGSVSWRDWLYNFKFSKYVVNNEELGSTDRKIAARAQMQKEALATLDGTQLSIHRGFANIYLSGLSQFNKQFRAALLAHYEHITTNPKPFRITTTGHSLGGALALIKANDLPRILLNSGLFSDPSRFLIETVSFGAPRVYDEASATKVEENLAGAHNIIRFVHEADPVPNLPTKQLGGADTGTPIFLSSIASGIIKNPGRHIMGSYIKYSPETFATIKKEFLLAQKTRSEIVALQKILGETTVFDTDDAAQRLSYLRDQNRFQQAFFVYKNNLYRF